MKQAAQLINSTELRKFAPLGKLSNEDARELLRTAITIQLSPGTPVFNQGDMDRQVFYLLKGRIELRGANQKTVIQAGTREALKPIGRHLPGQVSAKALEESLLVSFDADMLDLFLNWTNPNAYVVNEMATGSDHQWMNRLLQSRGLLRFSETQIHSLLERMNEVQVKAGQTVVSQNGADDFYYVIKKGRATVSRRPDAAARPIKLAELGEGDAFGEEALLTSASRGATITMEEDGTLMRLSKKDFSELLAEPLLSTIPWDEAQAMAATGGVFIDIRLQDEFKAMNIPGSVNIPLPVLRLKLTSLKQNRKYIIYCDDGSRSAVAAFLLNRHGFDAFILDRGLASAIPHLAPRQRQSAPLQDDATRRDPASAAAETLKQGEVSRTKQGNSYCSLVDYWGATVETVTDEGFADSAAVFQVEKTRATVAAPAVPKVAAANAGAAKPIAPQPATQSKPRSQPQPKPQPGSAPQIAALPTPPANPYGRSHWLRNSLIALAVLGLGAPFAADRFLSTGTAQPVAAVAPPMAQDTTPAQLPPVALPPAAVAPATEPPAETPPAPDTYLSQDGELLQLQATIIAPAADTADPAVGGALDPASRGFLD